jgi:hypothetical protein
LRIVWHLGSYKVREEIFMSSRLSNNLLRLFLKIDWIWEGPMRLLNKEESWPTTRCQSISINNKTSH